MYRIIKSLALTTALLALSSAAPAMLIEVTLGNDTSGFANGDTPNIFEVSAAQSGQPSPFDTSFGADAGLFGIEDFSATWTFMFAPITDVIDSAELSIGIYDHDSAASGLQVLSYVLNGFNLTADLNTLFEASGGAEAQYNEYTTLLDGATFASLAGGSAVVSLDLMGPGLAPVAVFLGGGVIETSTNGAYLLNSALSINTQDIVVAVPEPASLSLLALGIGVLGWSRRRRTVLGK